MCIPSEAIYLSIWCPADQYASVIYIEEKVPPMETMLRPAGCKQDVTAKVKKVRFLFLLPLLHLDFIFSSLLFSSLIESDYVV